MIRIPFPIISERNLSVIFKRTNTKIDTSKDFTNEFICILYTYIFLAPFSLKAVFDTLAAIATKKGKAIIAIIWKPAIVAIVAKTIDEKINLSSISTIVTIDGSDHMETGSRKDRLTFSVAIVASIWKPAFTGLGLHAQK